LAEFLASCRYLHVVPQIVRDRARARAEGEDPYGGDLLRRMKDMPRKTRDPRLRRISKALQIAVPQFGDIDLVDDNEGVPHLVASYLHWRPNASKQSEVLFSDGTLRFLGLLWSVAEKGGPLLLEEPELSLNDSVVSELPRLFSRMQRLSRRQIIVTTHSSALLDDPGIGLKEVHRILVDNNGSSVETLVDNKSIAAQVGAGMTVGQAVLPLLRPRDIESLGNFVVAN
jgi:predicted ATPase